MLRTGLETRPYRYLDQWGWDGSGGVDFLLEVEADDHVTAQVLDSADPARSCPLSEKADPAGGDPTGG